MVLRRQILPEQRVIEMSAAVEVDEGLQGDLGRDVGLGLGVGHFFGGGVEGGDVGVVVFAVVELHDFAADGGFEGAVVV